jgi:hypothetical protein
LEGYVTEGRVEKGGDGIVGAMAAFGEALGDTGGGKVGRIKRVMGIMGVLYATGWTVIAWHNMFVGGESSLDYPPPYADYDAL